jgi:hypothetical protein
VRRPLPLLQKVLPHFIAALWTELGARGDLCGAFWTLRYGCQFDAAFGTKFCAVGLGTAFWTNQLALTRNIHLFAPFFPFAVRANAHRVNLALGAGGINFDLGVGRAIPAQTFRSVPTGIAGKSHAAGAAMEVIFGLLDSMSERLVVRLSVACLGKTLGRRLNLAEDPTKHTGSLSKPAGGLPAAVRREFGPPGVVAAFAIELKLKAGVRTGIDRVVRKIFAEFDLAHAREVCVGARDSSRANRLVKVFSQLSAARASED